MIFLYEPKEALVGSFFGNNNCVHFHFSSGRTTLVEDAFFTALFSFLLLCATALEAIQVLLYGFLISGVGLDVAEPRGRTVAFDVSTVGAARILACRA